MAQAAENLVNAARGLEARFASVERLAMASDSNCEIAAAVRELREQFRVLCDLLVFPGEDAGWPRLYALPTRPPISPVPQPLGAIP